MTEHQILIIKRSNELIKNASFTKLVPLKRKTPACFLILTSGLDNFDLYGSYTSEKYFVVIRDKGFILK